MLFRHARLPQAIEQALQSNLMHSDVMAAEEAERKRRLEMHGFFGYRPRLAFLPGFRQCRGEMHVGWVAGVGKLTGLPAMCDGLIVATESA